MPDAEPYLTAGQCASRLLRDFDELSKGDRGAGLRHHRRSLSLLWGCLYLARRIPQARRSWYYDLLPFDRDEIEVILSREPGGLTPHDYWIDERIRRWVIDSPLVVDDRPVHCQDLLEYIWPLLDREDERSLVDRLTKDVSR